MKQIEKLVRDDSWHLQIYDDRYSRGIWAVLVPQVNAAYQLYEFLDGDEINSEFVCFYLNDEGAWLPTALGKNLSEAMANLELKVSNFEQDSKWKDDVYNAFQVFLGNDLLSSYYEKEPHLFRTGVVQPPGAFYILRMKGSTLQRITIDVRTFKKLNCEDNFIPSLHGWTEKDTYSLLDEGIRILAE